MWSILITIIRARRVHCSVYIYRWSEGCTTVHCTVVDFVRVCLKILSKHSRPCWSINIRLMQIKATLWRRVNFRPSITLLFDRCAPNDDGKNKRDLLCLPARLDQYDIRASCAQTSYIFIALRNHAQVTWDVQVMRDLHQRPDVAFPWRYAQLPFYNEYWTVAKPEPARRKHAGAHRVYCSWPFCRVIHAKNILAT